MAFGQFADACDGHAQSAEQPVSHLFFPSVHRLGQPQHNGPGQDLKVDPVLFSHHSSSTTAAAMLLLLLFRHRHLPLTSLFFYLSVLGWGKNPAHVASKCFNLRRLGLVNGD